MRKKVIIDCDPGIDDALALLLALKSPELEVIGITICFGNTYVEQAAKNALQILSWVNRLDIPVYVGQDSPWHQPLIVADETHGKNGLGDVNFPEIKSQIQDKKAVDFLLENANKNVSLIALAPLTNLAEALKRDLKFLTKFDRVLTMGGAFRTHGNSSPVAEFNYWSDVEAAQFVFENGNRILEMIPLDVTRKIVLTPKHLEKIKEKNHFLSEKILQITDFYIRFHWEQEQIKGCVINDPLVIAYFLDPNLCTGFESFVAIETTKYSRSQGQSIVDVMNFYKQSANAKILTQVDEKKFFNLFFNRVFS